MLFINLLGPFSTKLLRLITLLLVLYCTYIFLSTRLTYVEDILMNSACSVNQTQTSSKSHYRIEIQKTKPKCRKLDELTSGLWRLKENLTNYEIDERRRLDEENRVAIDWPAKLYRDDLKCGLKNHIPGYRLIAQCNPYNSTVPCCNHISETCGHGPDYCKCDNCTDHRDMIPAEIGTWVPHACDFELFTQEDACELLTRNNISITFIGDSLMRHIHTMGLLLLTNDYLEGSLPSNISTEHKTLCRGEHQITNKKCSVEIAAQKTDELSRGICKGNFQLRFELVQDYHWHLIEDVKKKVDEILEKENYWLVGGVGLHYQLNFDLMKKAYLQKLWEVLKKSKNGWPKLIWISIHAVHGFLRILTGPSNKRIELFNKKVYEYWSLRNVTVIDTFNMSYGLNSYDGRHYGFGFNELKINTLLRYLKFQYEK